MFRCKTQLWTLPASLLLLVLLVRSSSANSLMRPDARMLTSSFLRSFWKRASLRDSPVYYVSTFLRNKSPAPSQAQAASILSPLFKLPIEFMSNARPLEVVKGINKPSYGKPFRKQSLYQTSKMFFMPIKFLANGKPRRRVVIKSPPHYFRI
ncbi:uncharacterized protein LOC115312077 [Ixodes scapularis]|uniref:uncharacterized protein LOC115312077 n=1 Tax=Ixodes scapularis TaxID=6945 RepID=UPI001161B45D|nr:uncharacterized protein LOC115312077 [Ixodes scapularis]